MTIEQYKEPMRKYCDRPEKIKERLNETLEEIKFLEDIYMIGGKWHCFSKNFQNIAYEERQELCKKSSAYYSLLELTKKYDN